MAEGPPASPATTDARQPPTRRRRGRARAAWRDPKVLVLAGVLVVLLLAVAAVVWNRRSSDSATRPDTPTAVQVNAADQPRPTATISFDTVDGAHAYMVHFDDESAGSIRVEPSSCQGGRCSLTVDHRTAGSTRAITVSAVGAEGASSASPPVELPEWPAEEALTWPEEGPVGLVVVRRDTDGRPEYETEMVEAGADLRARVEARIDELEATEGVVSVAVDQPVRLNRASQDPGRIPEGVAAWHTLAWDYDSLPRDLDGSGVNVAVIDAGFRLDHPALQGASIAPVVAGAGSNTSNEDALAAGYNHGTEVTAFIAGRPDSGVPGVAPAASIRPYSMYTEDLFDILGQLTSGTAALASDLAESIVHAVDDGADVLSISMSFGCVTIGGPDQPDWCADAPLAPAIDYAESRGAVVVAATPNDGLAEFCDGEGDPRRSNQNAWPAMFETVVGVGGSRRDGERYRCSPEREYVDVLAPAHALQLAGSDGYEVGSGTSFATPLVAGLVALVLQAQPDMTPAEVRSLLAETRLPDGRVIPLDVMERLDRLEQGTTTAGETYLGAEAMVREGDWPHRGVTLSLDAAAEGGNAASMLTDVLGEPTATDPASWGGSQGPDDPRPVPGQGDALEPPECWSGLYGLLAWEEEGAPLLAALYAREPLPLDTGETVPAGALLGYRAYRDSARVVMTDEVAIGETQADLEAHYVDDDGRPYRGVEFLGDDGEFELVNVSSPSGGGRETSGALGPPFGRMSGQTDPDQDRVLERGAGSQCGLDVDLVSQLLGGEPPTDSDDGGGGGGGTDPGECAARIGIVLDASPSIVDAGAEGQVRDAATGVVDALAESGAEVRVSAFAGFPVSLTSGWVPLDDEEGRRLALQVVGSMAFEGQGTNWEAALMDLAGQGADVVVFVTDGNPNEYGVGITSSPSPDSTTDFDPAALAAGVSAAGVLRGQGSRIIAVGAGDVRADSLAQVAGPTEGEDYYVGGFGDLGASLSQIAADLCGRE